MIKTIIFKGIIWNPHLIMLLCENGYHARFILLLDQFILFLFRNFHILLT